MNKATDSFAIIFYCGCTHLHLDSLFSFLDSCICKSPNHLNLGWKWQSTFNWASYFISTTSLTSKSHSPWACHWLLVDFFIPEHSLSLSFFKHFDNLIKMSVNSYTVILGKLIQRSAFDKCSFETDVLSDLFLSFSINIIVFANCFWCFNCYFSEGVSI